MHNIYVNRLRSPFITILEVSDINFDVIGDYNTLSYDNTQEHIKVKIE
jgi:hypothetical protein